MIAIEKLVPWPWLATRGVAIVLLVLGIAVATTPADVPGLTIPGSPGAAMSMGQGDDAMSQGGGGMSEGGGGMSEGGGGMSEGGGGMCRHGALRRVWKWKTVGSRPIQ